MSSVDPSLQSPIRPSFPPSNSTQESDECQSIISALKMLPHPEGGYYVETDRDPYEVPNPFLGKGAERHDNEGRLRNASTSIFYLLTGSRSQGNFHRNKARTVHTLHKGRGRYVVIHADGVEAGSNARVESFVVGQDVANGERLQWIVDGGKYKASFLLPDEDSEGSHGLLISETVIPGFNFRDHDFLEGRVFRNLVTPDQAEELKWLLRAQEQ